jgi:hypothetical protein
MGGFCVSVYVCCGRVALEASRMVSTCSDTALTAASTERPRLPLSVERAHHNGFGKNIAFLVGFSMIAQVNYENTYWRGKKTYKRRGSAMNHAESACRSRPRSVIGHPLDVTHRLSATFPPGSAQGMDSLLNLSNFMLSRIGLHTRLRTVFLMMGTRRSK